MIPQATLPRVNERAEGMLRQSKIEKKDKVILKGD